MNYRCLSVQFMMGCKVNMVLHLYNMLQYMMMP